ncbi:MAG: PKD domain-containing protein [Bacteroidales bacterium]|nr:PKD domain-containing protein [Bacteroidales bacterium]
MPTLSTSLNDSVFIEDTFKINNKALVSKTFYLFGTTNDTTDAVVVTVNPLPTTDAGSNVVICIGDYTQLNASGGTSYLWSPTGSLDYYDIENPIASPTLTTTYTVTVTDANNCSATDDVVVSVIQQLDASFTVTNLCQTNVTFQSNSYDPNLTYMWDFENNGNFVTDNSPTVSHNYTMPGYYLVTLQVSYNNICPAITSQLIQVIPSITNGYNANCCSNNDVTYTQDGDFPASTNATWTDGNNPFGNASSPIKVRGTIWIPAGIEITIEDMTFEFDPNSRVIVEREGKLTLDSTIFQGLAHCHTMWQGIEVWGDAGYRHFLPVVSVPPSPPVADVTGQSKQGKLVMLNDAMIRDAHIGVLIGRSNICISSMHDPTQVCHNLPYLLNYSGGIIEADSAIFERNAVGVKFLPFKPATGTGYVNYNASKITKCTFEGGTLFDPGYSTSNTTYQYPNNNNPTFANANATQHAITGIYMWSVRYVTLTGNTFGTANPDLIEGIKSYDSPYNVSTSLFQNLDYGIKIFNSNSTVGANKIFDNFFVPNVSNNGFFNINEYPIQIEGARFTQIINNSIGDENADYPWSTSGIFLKNSMNFRVQDNVFNKINRGVEVINSSHGFSKGITNGFGGGRIASLNRAEGNDFVECPLDIETKGYNQRLQLHCNTSDNYVTGFYNGSNWENYGYFTHQGQLDYSVEARLPAGNAFNPYTNETMRIINNNFEILQIPYPNTLPVYYTYYRHGGLSSPNRIPSSQSLQYNINPYSFAYNAQTSCLPCSTSTGSYRSVLQDKEADYDSLVAVYDTVFSYLDSNATQLLLDSINGSMNEDSLLVLLLAHSPLSDTVIAAALNRPLSTNNIDDLLIPNSPLSDVGRYYLDIIIDTLPSEMQSRILDVQAHNPNYSTLSSLDCDMLVLENSYQLQLNSFIEYLLDNDSLSEAITILDSLDNNDAKRLVLSTYLADSNYTEVASRLENFEPLTDEEEDWKDLLSLLYELATDSLTVFDMDSTQEAFVRALAEDNTCSPASVNAQAILRLLYEEEFPECPAAFQERKASVLWPASKQKAETCYLGQNIPNPFSNTTLIPYYLPENTSHAAICVYDISGKKIYETVLQNDKGTISLTLDNFKAGIYLYSLIIDNKPIQTKRMVIIK